LPNLASYTVSLKLPSSHILSLTTPGISHEGVCSRKWSAREWTTINAMNIFKDKIENVYLKYFDSYRKMEFIIERVDDIKEMLEDLNYEISMKQCDTEN
jgi:hypothetical protein